MGQILKKDIKKVGELFRKSFDQYNNSAVQTLRQDIKLLHESMKEECYQIKQDVIDKQMKRVKQDKSGVHAS